MTNKEHLKLLIYSNFKAACSAVMFFAFISAACNGQSVRSQKNIVMENFENTLDTALWKTEMVPGPDASVQTKNGKLVIDSPGGVSVWFNKMLTGNIAIEYDWKVIVDGGKNDRLSDLNQFWMATDPKNKNLFTRNGVFEAYDSLQLYYVGMGGNSNTTTRFRKYQNGKRELLQEYVDKDHLLTPNHTYHIRIVVRNGQTTFSADGRLYFSYDDPSPLTHGYFGFRSTWSRHEIDNFRVYQLGN